MEVMEFWSLRSAPEAMKFVSAAEEKKYLEKKSDFSK